jgi:hypothetical protein
VPCDDEVPAHPAAAAEPAGPEQTTKYGHSGAVENSFVNILLTESLGLP